MDDEGGSPDRATPPTITGPSAPVPATSSADTGAPSAVAAMSADVTAAWSKLDRHAQVLARTSIAAFAITLVGLPLGVWHSAQFALIVLVATAIAAAAAWFGDSPAVRTMPVPLGTIEHGAAIVTAVLTALKVVEALFDLDLGDAGAIVELVLSVALASAAVAMLVAVNRRGTDAQAAFRRGDEGVKLATLGWVLVLLGWALNLSLSFWTMGQAALPLAVFTIAALTILEAPRIEAPIPVAWIGAAIGAFGALLVLGHWADLTSLGRTEVELDPLDFLGFLGYTAGAALVVAGGFLSGRSQWTPGRAPSDGPAGPN